MKSTSFCFIPTVVELSMLCGGSFLTGIVIAVVTPSSECLSWIETKYFARPKMLFVHFKYRNKVYCKTWPKSTLLSTGKYKLLYSVKGNLDMISQKWMLHIFPLCISLLAPKQSFNYLISIDDKLQRSAFNITFAKLPILLNRNCRCRRWSYRKVTLP